MRPRRSGARPEASRGNVAMVACIRPLGGMAYAADLKDEGASGDSPDIEKTSLVVDPSEPDSTHHGALPGQSEGNQRAQTLAMLYEQAARLAAAGDVSAARALHATIGALLGDDVGRPAQVVDLASRRKS
jgi:hypothetical protein